MQLITGGGGGGGGGGEGWMGWLATHLSFACSFVHNTIGVGQSVIIYQPPPIVQYSKVPVATHSATPWSISGSVPALSLHYTLGLNSISVVISPLALF